MEIYRVTYKQLCPAAKEILRLDIHQRNQKRMYDIFRKYALDIPDQSPIWTSEDGCFQFVATLESRYNEHIQLIAIPIPLVALLEPILHSFVTLPEDKSHWCYITKVEYLGPAIETITNTQTRSE